VSGPRGREAAEAPVPSGPRHASRSPADGRSGERPVLVVPSVALPQDGQGAAGDVRSAGGRERVAELRPDGAIPGGLRPGFRGRGRGCATIGGRRGARGGPFPHPAPSRLRPICGWRRVGGSAPDPPPTPWRAWEGPPVLKRRTGWMVTGLWAGVPEGGTGGHNPATGPARKGPGPPRVRYRSARLRTPPEVSCASCSSPVRSTV
jgi:hypothetical protein